MAAPLGAYTTHGAWNFVSAPKLNPPKLRSDAKTASKGLASGFFFVANFKNLTLPGPFVGQGGPLILDSHLQPVWFLPAPSNLFTNNLREQTYQGKPALSWWEGVVTNTGATTRGEDLVVNQQYHQVAALKGAGGWVITQHELLIDGHDAWVTANKPTPVAPNTVPGCPTCTTVVDSAVQEYDLHTGKLLVNWSALAHIPLSQSQVRGVPGIPLDAYHVNSIQLVSGGKRGRFLASMRNTWGAYLVDVATGKVQWTLGAGAASSFKLPKNGVFHWQHDVELHPGGLVTVFDDACCGIVGPGRFGPPAGPSRGLLLSINTGKHTVGFVRQYVHPQVAGNPVEVAFQGNMQLLPNRNVVIGWGSAPFFSEFSFSGKLLFDVAMPSPDLTYRAYVSGWVGSPPVSEMREAVRTVHGKPTVYVTWNGATQVIAWRVLGGADAKHLRLVGTASKSSFETAVTLKRGYNTYEVQAVGSHGRVLGTSRPFGAQVRPPVNGGY